MSRIFRLLACLVPLALLVAAPQLLASSTPHPIVGIGDDKLDLFGDPKFLALGIRNVRYDMAWDALSVPSERTAVTRWMTAAKAHGLSVLVTIDHSRSVIWRRVNGHRKAFSQTRVLPSAARYVAAFRAFRARFPWVTQFATWDETNFYGEATYDKESLVASYYLGIRKACPTCTILAAEFLDVTKHQAIPMATWAAQFIKDAHMQPAYWGLNNYEDANHLVTSGVRDLLGAVRGKIWLAETGGIVYRYAHPHAGFPQNAAHAAVADRFLLSTLAAVSPRIQRVYLYEWDARSPHDGWDTALISSTGEPRESYVVLAEELYSWGIHPNCTISRVPPTCTGLGGGALQHGATGATGATGSTGSTGATGSTGSTGATGATA